MIDLTTYAGREIAVMGLGRSGLATARALLRGGARLRAWDDDPARRENAAAEGMPVSDLAAVDWSGIAMLVLSPGIPHTWPQPHPVAAAARAAGVEIVGDIELLVRAEPEAGYVGVTGTNGKSTTTALIGHMLRRAGRRIAVGGNLGTPALELETMGRSGTYVLEMSSFQLELTHSLVCDVAVLLNLSPDHLERHGGMDGYIAAKTRIFAGQGAKQAAVVGLDDPQSARIFDTLVARQRQRVVPISAERRVDGGIYLRDTMLWNTMEGDERPLASLRATEALPGRHNAQNAAAASAAARLLGLSEKEIGDAIATYPGLPHRQEIVATIDGVRYVNDSKATNPEAAARALSCYDAVYWIAGGRAKKGGFEAVIPYLRRVRRAFLIGEAAEAVAAAIAGHTRVEHCGDLATAVRRAHRAAVAARGDAVVLLSPGCASFDQFRDFEHRGDAFRAIVARLRRNRPAPETERETV